MGRHQLRDLQLETMQVWHFTF
uniref:Uncharacterized protein n=1 Tax=Anguilla anguilla TaxID=7936 RepID=A0A0E9TD08_ANGAN